MEEKLDKIIELLEKNNNHWEGYFELRARSDFFYNFKIDLLKILNEIKEGSPTK